MINQANMPLEKSVAEVIIKILKNAGFETKTEVSLKTSSASKHIVDIVAWRYKKKYYIEIKLAPEEIIRSDKTFTKKINDFSKLSKKDNAKPVLVVFAVITNDVKQDFERVSDVDIEDISNLLDIVNGTELQDEFVSMIPFSVEHIKPQKGKLTLDLDKKSNIGSSLIKRLNNCMPGIEESHEFEIICKDILHHVFADDLCLWKYQAGMCQGLYRADLVCRIKDDLPKTKTFWRMMENFFHSKYIVFEFKNYTDKITQKEVYTTERYLYTKALRGVAIIIAKGFDKHSRWAMKGSLRENKKLILPVTTKELKRMVQMKERQEDPAEILMNILDKFMFELEK